jgi:hypothetical protein
MGFASKLGQLAEGFVEGLAPGVPLGLRIQEGRNASSRFERNRTEKQLRGRFNAGDREGAIAEAERLGLTDLSATFRGEVSGADRQTLQAGAVGLQGGVAGARTAGQNIDLSTTQGRTVARQTLGGAATELSSSAGLVGGRAEQLGDPEAITTQPVQQATALAQQFQTQIRAIETLEKEISNYLSNIDADPEERNVSLDRIRQAFVEGGESEDDWTSVEIGLKNRRQKLIDDNFMSIILPYTKDPEVLLKKALESGISPSIEAAATGMAESLKKQVTADNRHMHTLMKERITMAQFLGKRDSATGRDLVLQAADMAEELGLEDLSNTMRTKPESFLQATSAMNREEMRQWMYRQSLIDPFIFHDALGLDIRDNKPVSMEQVERALDNLFPEERKVTSNNESSVQAGVQNIVKRLNVLQGLSRTSQAEIYFNTIENEPPEVRSEILSELDKLGWVLSEDGSTIEPKRRVFNAGILDMFSTKPNVPIGTRNVQLSDTSTTAESTGR